MTATRKRKRLVIAIDGPAGSGKSTTARLLAQRLGYLYLDTGAMYRAITVKVIRRGLSKEQIPEIVRFLPDTRVELEQADHGVRVWLDGEDVTEEIRTPEVDREISWVCQIPEVREKLVSLQRQAGEKGGIVAEGRDMGTVVFPDADIKFFLVASLEERGKRRWLDLKRKGIDIPLEEVIRDLERRDRIDASRDISPLKKADDAIEIDTTHLTIEEQVEVLLKKIQERFGDVLEF